MYRPFPQSAFRSRRGFTLVELLAVLVVISILVALLLPAVGSVRRNVQVAQVRTEIAQLEAGIAAFRMRFQMDPPSQITLHKTAAGWNGDPQSLSMVRRMWPEFNPGSGNLDFRFSGNDLTIMGGECLVFFLGGMLHLEDTNGNNVWDAGTADRIVPIGFSKNPQTPFAANITDASRDGPYFEFRTERFVDIDGNHMPEYRDPLPAQRVGYAYNSSYDGQGYRTTATSFWANEYSGVSLPTGGTSLSGPYRQGTGANAPPFNAKRFQIVSPGIDGSFGPGGSYLPDANERLPGTGREDERDNITNFAPGMLAQ